MDSPNKKKEVSYTVIVRDEEKKYPQVYSGRCCHTDMMEFVSCTSRKEKKDQEIRGCGCILQ